MDNYLHSHSWTSADSKQWMDYIQQSPLFEKEERKDLSEKCKQSAVKSFNQNGVRHRYQDQSGA